MGKAILNTRDKRLTFTFLDKEYIVDVTGMDYDHWDTIKDVQTNIEYDINIWFDEFEKGSYSFQLCVYELVSDSIVNVLSDNNPNEEYCHYSDLPSPMAYVKIKESVGNSLERFDVISINEQGLIIDGDEVETVMFGDSDKETDEEKETWLFWKEFFYY